MSERDIQLEKQNEALAEELMRVLDRFKSMRIFGEHHNEIFVTFPKAEDLVKDYR